MCLPDLLAVLMFALISFAYFFPADIEGRILYRHDSSAGRGSGVELTEYYQRTGEPTRWTNSLFSGMPTYQMAPSYKSADVLNGVGKFYHLWLPENVWYVFAIFSASTSFSGLSISASRLRLSAPSSGRSAATSSSS